jgi:hypothetical protein
MIHILDYKSATFDFNPQILLQYVDLPRIFQKFISETDYIKSKLEKDGGVFYQQVSDDKLFTLNNFYEYVDSNKNIEILFCNIDIFKDCHIWPNSFFPKISKKYPNIKFIVSSDETFFNYTRSEYSHKNVFYITNGLSNPYSFVDNVDNITNLASYYILNDYLQEDYVKFIEMLFHTSNGIVRNKKYNFYNGVHKPHRIKSYELIKKHNLLDEGYFSYADFAYMSKESEHNQEFMDFLGIKTEDEYKKYISQFEIPLLYDTEDSDPNIFVAFATPPQTSFQSYFSITTETHFQESSDLKEVNFSEKSFKPFYGFNIPLIIGQSIGLQYLRDLGFDLFEDFFDLRPVHNKEQTFEQLDKNLEKIKKMSKLDIHKFYTKNIDRVYNNFSLLTNRLKERDIENLNNFLNG